MSEHKDASPLTKALVPLYDGRESFKLGRYWEKPYKENIKKDSALMLLFSVKRGNLPKNMQGRGDIPPGTNFAVYLNVLGIIVLSEPGERFSYIESQEHPETFGVRKVEAEMPVVPEGEVGETEDPYL